ncbi:MAG: dephospho-CoA kinase [Synergistaceae bacterium]|jgi:dephospho-CoA kinase|nr:dephospho-CoA kinase [Synergistaceae bacterium]
MFSVVITGEIGAGKSTLASVWRDMGANLIDLDSLAKEQWARPEVRRAAEARWGAGVYHDGRPDYKLLADHVFKDADESRFASEIVHPGAMSETSRIFHNLGGWVVLEIPLLFELGWFDLIDCVICVTSTYDLRMSRNASRGWDEDEMAAREKFLVGSGTKQAMSDIVLCNVGSLEAWEAKARELGNLMLKMATVHEISVLCANLEEANRIGGALVDDRLAASVNISEITTIYRWKGSVKRSPEHRLRALTIEKNLRRAMQLIRRNHSYEMPVITAREVVRADYHTLKWVVENCEPDVDAGSGI